MVATVGDAQAVSHKSRQMAAAIGLTPRQNSSGDKHRLLGISKRGDVYLRMLMVHGARVGGDERAKHKDDRLSRWVTEIATAAASECGSGGLGQQERTHGLGHAAQQD